MEGFTSLERAVLEAILSGLWPDEAAALRAMLATARVTERENTGHGFYTHFELDRSLPPLMIGGSRHRGYLHASGEIADFPAGWPMGFMLAVIDGVPDHLEGFQYGPDLDLRTWDLAALRATRVWREAEAGTRH